jgi:hypothetical protein
MRVNIIMVAVLTAVSANAVAKNISGEMLLRDAHYWYNMPVDGFSSNQFIGSDCDILQLVLDVNAGYTDIAGADVASTISIKDTDKVDYPDRITANASMFSYTLYSNSGLKMFQFYDKNATGSKQVGTITAFAYCFSTNPGARLRTFDGNQNWCVYTNGTTSGASITYSGANELTLSHARTSTICN